MQLKKVQSEINMLDQKKYQLKVSFITYSSSFSLSTNFYWPIHKDMVAIIMWIKFKIG